MQGDQRVKQNFRWEFRKKNGYKFQTGGNYGRNKSKEAFKQLRSKFQIKKEPVNEKAQEKASKNRRQLRCYEYGSYSHFRRQCDKLKKNFETLGSNETVKNRPYAALAPYASVEKVNGNEMPILRDTGATLDLICKKCIPLFMYTNETVWIRAPLEEIAVCLSVA